MPTGAATLSFDKPSYAAGDVVTATVVDPALVESDSNTYKEQDGDIVTQTLSVQHQPALLLSAAGRVWKLVSVTGTTAVFTTKA